MKFYVFAPTFHLRPKNTDWIYNRTLPGITAYNPNVEIYLQQSLARSLAYNARAAAEIAKNRFHVPVPMGWLPEYESKFDLGDLRRSGADLIYGHTPTNVRHLPIVCHTGPIFEREMRAKGVANEIIEREKQQKRHTMQAAQLITLHSEIAAETLRELDENRADRVRVLPFFMPHLQLVSDEDVTAKFHEINAEKSKTKLLFVGREAKRKGLLAVLEAFERLNTSWPGRLHLTVVSNFADGEIESSQNAGNITFLGEADRKAVQALMRDAHMLLMPSRFETFGWVYLEAMAAGAVALAADHPVQREILAGGSAGLLVKQGGEEIAAAVSALIENPQRFEQLAKAGLQRVREEYAPELMAKRMEELGHEARILHRIDRGKQL